MVILPLAHICCAADALPCIISRQRSSNTSGFGALGFAQLRHTFFKTYSPWKGISLFGTTILSSWLIAQVNAFSTSLHKYFKNSCASYCIKRFENCFGNCFSRAVVRALINCSLVNDEFNSLSKLSPSNHFCGWCAGPPGEGPGLSSGMIRDANPALAWVLRMARNVPRLKVCGTLT